MILYLDASAWLKRYLPEIGSESVQRAALSAERWMMSRVGFVEMFSALARRGAPTRIEAFRDEWPLLDVIELNDIVAQRAAELAAEDRLGTLDAIHLASALPLAEHELVFATWDRRLHAAARNRGLTVLPEALS